MMIRSTNWLVILVVFTWCGPVRALQVQDVVRLKGSEGNKLVGIGLVVGLNGTGDGGKSLPAMHALAKTIQRLNNPAIEPNLVKDTKNVAMVYLSVDLPETGVREGDRVDIQVSSTGAAKSLAGGELLLVPLVAPPAYEQVYAWAGGTVTIEDEQTPTVGVVEDGAQLSVDIRTRLTDEFGQLTLVIKEQNASWPVATNLANLINNLVAPDVPDIARAVDQKNVVVALPIWERENPANFISGILQTYIDPSQVSGGAKIVINERTGTIIIGGDVRISPVLISHGELIVSTTTPNPEPTVLEPMVTRNPFLAFNPEQNGDQKTHGPTLSDLESAFNQLKVEARDRIEIIKAMHESGYLLGQLIVR